MAHSGRRFPIAAVAVAAAGLAVCSTNVAAWGVAGSSGPVTVDMSSVGASKRIAGANGVWVLYAPTLSVDCAPPRGCYAKTQRSYYDFSCAPRYAVLVELNSMDLNGTVVKHEVVEAAPAYTPAYDYAAAQVLDTFCPLPDRY
jgi:hypothetical protein